MRLDDQSTPTCSSGGSWYTGVNYQQTTSLGWHITIQCYYTAMRQEQSPDRYCNKNGERVREGRKGYETSAVRRKKYLWSMDSGNWNGVHTLPGQNGSTAGGGNCLWSFLSPNLNSALREKRRKGENWIGKLPVELGEEQQREKKEKARDELWSRIRDRTSLSTWMRSRLQE